MGSIVRGGNDRQFFQAKTTSYCFLLQPSKWEGVQPVIFVAPAHIGMGSDEPPLLHVFVFWLPLRPYRGFVVFSLFVRCIDVLVCFSGLRLRSYLRFVN